MSYDTAFILHLLREINDRRDKLPLYSRQIWPGQSQTQESKTIEHLDCMINEELLEGIRSRDEEAQSIGEKPDVQINEITWRGEGLLNENSE